MRKTWRWVAAMLAIGMYSAARADLRLPKVISDHAVLQRDLPLVVWGWAEPGEKVKVALGRQTRSTAADTSGAWHVTLAPLKVGGPLDMVVTGKNTITVKDLLVGDVWICSGQSNMEFGLGGADNAGDAIKAATNSNIRLLHVTADQLPAPATDIPNTWAVCSPQTVGGFSAVGYFFGKTVNEETGVPIGLIESAWGGTAIEPWTSPDAWKRIDELAKLNTDSNSLGRIYNGRIAPLAPYGIKGALWYQGESNGGDDDIYFHKMRGLIGCWRNTWRAYAGKNKANAGNAPEYEFPFYFVQLANFQGANDNPAGGDGWAKIRMAQLKALTIPKTGMALAIDIGDGGDIHPRNKEDVGKRLAFWALAKDYGKSKVACSGPLYKGMTVKGNTIRVSFDYTGRGLIIGRKEGHGAAVEVKASTDKAGDAPKLQRFAIAGQDKNWFWADAVIDGPAVVVSSTNVPNPVAVRYAFSMNPAGCNLYNKEGLPASPFRTDNW
jgi:sialate O-acetylesterase